MVAEQPDWLTSGRFNILGYVLISLLVVTIFVTIGSAIDFFKSLRFGKNENKFLMLPILFLLIVAFITYLHTSDSVSKCAFFFDGDENLNRSSCYYHQARYGHAEMLTENFCNKNIKNNIEHGIDYHSQCLHIAAQIWKDKKICDLIRDDGGNEYMDDTPILKSQCYGGVAVRLGDVSICNFITHEGLRSGCERYVNEDLPLGEMWTFSNPSPIEICCTPRGVAPNPELKDKKYYNFLTQIEFWLFDIRVWFYNL